ncbi:hypothetical protein Pmar_PMAR014962 [Perkinsus marinus ATCC 50983]|uniref:Histone deacetylase interacting domain-containing protein n=1 Tax=Perkinsus marinus (strain ATCC 50983 / TXsc) TaxID=423536 RepID=C5LFC9_PERM5|nr:hypothetical protein Pmar_PMAR014962 [Perkinsus marinus ATCC 50983]EER04561.1 hypothetical protein Pmar_PMAR014962 [Perkinsus marinus ATCC 50983]|eukprot:XP_002772745.1 hypothetical protein Pmar_PMAR014962 [Perkinsus marinus ATCC 50983]
MPSAAQRLAEKSTMGGRERVALEMLAALLPPTLAHELYKTISIWLAGGFEVSTVSTFLGRILSHLKSCTTVPSIDEEEGGNSPSGAEAQQKYDAIFDIYTEQERTVLLNRLRELDHAVVEVCNRHLVDLINGALLKREAAKQREVMKEAPKAEGCRSYLNHLSFPGESAEAAVCRERLLRTPPGIINNTWMGVSLGTEEAQDFKYFRRNHSEEALFNNEDHKYATTFTVKCVSLTVRRLEELQKKLEEMAEGEREAYELKMPHDITSQHLEQIINSYTSTAIGQKMADELLLHPMKTLPLLVTRLKETEASLTSPTSGLVAAASKAWLKVDKRSYLPGLDHRSYYFRGHCSKNSTSRAFLTDLRQSDSPLGIVEEEREPEWLSKSDSGRYPIAIIGNAATFQSLLQDGVANGAEPTAQGPPVLLCMPNAEIHELALKLVKGKVEGRWAEEPVDGISIDVALHTLEKILQPFLPASAELKSSRPSNGTKIFDDVTTLKGQEQSNSRPVFLTQTQYSLLRYYHIIYSRLARAASDIARLKKQLEHKQQQQGQEESITSESPQSLPGAGGDNSTLSTDGNNVVTTVPGSQGVDSLVNSIVETFLSSSDPTGMGGFNNIVREHLGFNRGYYLYTMPKVLARMSEALQLVCLGRADVVSKRKTSDSGSRVPRRDSATQRLFALNESIQSVELNSETAKELSILGLECYRHYNYYDAGPDPEGLGGSIIAASVHDDGWFSCCELKA